MIIGLDFDDTVMTNNYPYLGEPIPGALKWIRKWQDEGAKIVLCTMRSGKSLERAAQYLESNGVELYGLNETPTQKKWTESPKPYAHIYIDDRSFGTPLVPFDGHGVVDWENVGPSVMEILKTCESVETVDEILESKGEGE